MIIRIFNRLLPWLASHIWCIGTVNKLSQFFRFLNYFSCAMRLSLSACNIDAFHWSTELVFILDLPLFLSCALTFIRLADFILDFSSISLSLDSYSFLFLSIGLPPETEQDTEIYTKGKISPASTLVLCHKPINIMFKHSFISPIVDVWMSVSWNIFSNSDTSVCTANATPLALFFGSSVADSTRNGLNKIILATISSVLNILPPEVSLINCFFTPSTFNLLGIASWYKYIFLD